MIRASGPERQRGPKYASPTVRIVLIVAVIAILALTFLTIARAQSGSEPTDDTMPFVGRWAEDPEGLVTSAAARAPGLLARYLRIDTTNPPGVELEGARFLDDLLEAEGLSQAVGSIWVDTAYELTEGKDEKHPGTITVVNGSTWNIARKIALPKQKMNNGHNFWTSHNQNQVYQTEWHGNSVYVINRLTGKLIQEITEDAYPGLHICHNPAHVMTRVDTQQVHWGCNGDDYVAEFNKVPLSGGRLKFNRLIPMSTGIAQTQPHAHWMGFDGKSMITPNSNTGDATTFDFHEYAIIDQEQTGTLPIASGHDAGLEQVLCV